MTAPRGNDPFAAIAEQRRQLRDASLTEPPLPAIPNQRLPVHDGDAHAFRPGRKIDSHDALAAELARQRRKHARFLKSLSPELPIQRRSRELDRFDWRVEEPADRENASRAFRGEGAWEPVRIPHYGPPLGRARAYYRTTFKLAERDFAAGALWLRFRGADYAAAVFVNGALVGTHEGFFAPFECDITDVARRGENVLLVRLDNDAICMGNGSWGEEGADFEGEKIYAATGPGYDDPQVGWHHCPPGMGLYQPVVLESRPPVHVGSLFVRPLCERGRCEVWMEIHNRGRYRAAGSLRISIFGENFRRTVVRDLPCEPPGPLGPGVNSLRSEIDMADFRSWSPEAPWLYAAQVRLLDEQGRTTDAAGQIFGMRSFRLDERSEPRGRMHLNGRQIRLRGANTMGHLQQCVIRGDREQLIDDILLAKIANMNFLRLTQRPVQEEIYDCCSRLGLMTQTDLPLFGVLRRNQFCEAVRQAEEMERLVRPWPCNIMDSFINEPFPSDPPKAMRHLTREELEAFFTAAGHAVRLANPDRVLKPVDGDYDPPGPSLPDNHCYCAWYNGHGVDLGRLYKGHWQATKAGWMHACGEFGAEGLEDEDLMRSAYPPQWLPGTEAEEARWSPGSILKAQTGRFHFMWFETQRTLAGWISASQDHQAWATRLMTECFRRDERMNSIAIHLFIDAFPAGWMKSIMDCRRRAKPAYFAYLDALSPRMVSLRCDRQAFFPGERMAVEAWTCNDLDEPLDGATIRYQMEIDGEVVQSGRTAANIESCRPLCQGRIRFRVPSVRARTVATLRLGLFDAEGRQIHHAAIVRTIFPRPSRGCVPAVRVLGERGGRAAELCRELGIEAEFGGRWREGETLLLDEPRRLSRSRRTIETALAAGATAVLLELPPGEYDLLGEDVEVRKAGMRPRHAVMRNTGHELVEGFAPEDFRFWYDPAVDHPAPFLATTLHAGPAWRPILRSGNGDWKGDWGPAEAAMEREVGPGVLRVCQLSLAGRIAGNPVAEIFARRLLQAGSPVNE